MRRASRRTRRGKQISERPIKNFEAPMVLLRSRECCRFALWVLLVGAAWMPGLAEDRNYLEQFKKEYPPAVEKMRQVYSD